MDQLQIERLHAAIVAQDEYPGEVCPTERNLARFVAGEMADDEARRAEDHLAECDPCRQAADRLRQAATWFAGNRAAVFAGLEEKAAVAGLEPWASCPSPQELEAYLLNTNVE